MSYHIIPSFNATFKRLRSQFLCILILLKEINDINGKWHETTTKILSSYLFVSVLKKSVLHLIFILPSGINGTILSFGIFCYNEIKAGM